MIKCIMTGRILINYIAIKYVYALYTNSFKKFKCSN